jgi:DnaJ-class molecular chaperone
MSDCENWDDLCDLCDGHGVLPVGVTCPRCNGTGERTGEPEGDAA